MIAPLDRQQIKVQFTTTISLHFIWFAMWGIHFTFVLAFRFRFPFKVYISNIYTQSVDDNTIFTLLLGALVATKHQLHVYTHIQI